MLVAARVRVLASVKHPRFDHVVGVEEAEEVVEVEVEVVVVVAVPVAVTMDKE